MRPDDRHLIAQLCALRAGLQVDTEKDYPVESRLAPVARREGFSSIGDLLQAVRNERDNKLIWAVVEAMTLNETSFFRDRGMFRALMEALPTLAARRDGRPLRIWSAACSTGQEIYSLAMMLDEMALAHPGLRAEMFGSDIAERCLEKAQSGLYTQFEVQRGLPIRSLVKHFEKTEEMWQIAPRLRQAVRWRRVNLIADLSPLGRFDVVLCRNALNGMTEAARTRVLESLAATLPEDGLLVLGAGEEAAGVRALQPLVGQPGLFRPDPAVRVAA